MTRLRLLLVLASGALLLPAGPAAAQPAGEQSASSGDVVATLTWKAGAEEYDGVVSPRLKIERAGAVALDAGITDLCKSCFFNGDAKSPNVEVRDLDGDGEPDVLVQGFTGGPHCCTDLGIWH